LLSEERVQRNERDEETRSEGRYHKEKFGCTLFLFKEEEEPVSVTEGGKRLSVVLPSNRMGYPQRRGGKGLTDHCTSHGRGERIFPHGGGTPLKKKRWGKKFIFYLEKKGWHLSQRGRGKPYRG